MSATKRKTKKKSAAAADWSLVPHGPVSGAAVGSLATIAATVAGSTFGVSPMWAAFAASVGALGQVVEAANRDGGPGALLYRLGCWLGAGSWASWHLWDGHDLSANSVAALGAGAVAAATLAPMAKIRPQSRRLPGSELVPVDRPGGTRTAEWEARFKRVCKVAVQVVDIWDWDNDAGFTIVGQLPPGPVTISQIGAAVDALATDARLPDGCGVEPPQPGANRGQFLLPVSTRNLLGNRGDESPPRIPYPSDYGSRSLLDPIPLGVRRDSSVATASIREDSMLVVGPKGGGKTNLLDVLTAGVGLCRDALVWHLDLNGGGMSQFWLQPWLEGKVDRPPIDWAAPNPEEALLMTQVMIGIVKDRKSSYRTFKARNNVKLLPISPDLPAIVLLIDEGAEALSPTNRDPLATQIRENVEELLRIGRNEAAFPHVSALRPTQGTISPDVLSGCAVRMGLFGTSLGDLSHMYGWNRGANADELPVKGTAFIGRTPEAPVPMKVYFLEPSQIEQIATVISRARPELDQASAEVANGEFQIRFGPRGSKEVTMDNIYARRYERMRAAFMGEPETVPAAPTKATARPQAATPSGGNPGRLRLLKGGALKGGAAAWPDLTAGASEPAAPADPDLTTASRWPDITASRAPQRQAPRPAAQPAARPVAQPAARETPAITAGETVAVPELLARALVVFAAAGDERMHSETLAEALGFSDQWALAEALRPYGVTPLPQKFKRGGVNRRGYARDDIVAAATGGVPRGTGSGDSPNPPEGTQGHPTPSDQAKHRDAGDPGDCVTPLPHGAEHPENPGGRTRPPRTA